MIPLHDDNPTTITPVLTIGFIATCCLVFLYQVSLSGQPGQVFVYQYGAIPAVVFGHQALPPEARKHGLVERDVAPRLAAKHPVDPRKAAAQRFAQIDAGIDAQRKRLDGEDLSQTPFAKIDRQVFRLLIGRVVGTSLDGALEPLPERFERLRGEVQALRRPRVGGRDDFP